MKRQVRLGIDLGGTNCRLALVSGTGEISRLRRVATAIENGFEAFMKNLLDLCGELREAADIDGLELCGVGMGCPGVISADGRVLASPNLPDLVHKPLAGLLRERLGVEVRVLNDANAIAWGEALFGAGREFSSFITLTLGTGVGGGLVLGRELWTGADGAAGEAGHLVVEPEGRRCGCGGRGCLEQYASASGIVKSVRESLQGGERSLLAGLSDDELTSRKVAEAAQIGDRVAMAALEAAGRRLGQALAGMANLLNLDGVVITGGASESLELFRPAMEEEIRARAFEIPARRLKIVRGQLGDKAGILGAALMTSH